MSTWHIYPAFIRLTDSTHVPAVFVLDIDTLSLVGAMIADTLGAIPGLTRELVLSRDLPDTVVHLENRHFPGLLEALDNGLIEAGRRPSIRATLGRDALEWVLIEGRRIIQAVQALKPCSTQDVAVALHAQLTDVHGNLR